MRLLSSINSTIGKGRVAAGKKLFWRVAGRRFGVMPEGMIRSIPEKILCPESFPHLVEQRVVRHADTEVYEYGRDLPPAFRKEMHFASRYVYRLRDVYVDLKTGACLTDTNIFQESYGSLRKWLTMPPLAVGRRPGLLQCDDIVTCVPAVGYYHFLLEEIPRLLHSLRAYPELRVFASANAPGFVIDVLRHIQKTGVMQSDVVFCEKEYVKVHDYVFTAAEAYSGIVHSDDVKLLRDLGSALVQDPDGARTKRLYISRRQADRRTFENEEDVERWLEDLGFQVVYLEKLPFLETVKLCREADIIVASHGAGLANLVWHKNEVKVVEIFPVGFVNDCFARLCCILGLKYWPMWARPKGMWGEVDLSELRDVMDKVLHGEHHSGEVARNR